MIAALVGGLAAGVSTIASSGRAATGARSSTVRLVERDFKISAPTHVAPGNATLIVRNNGPDTHELIVVRSNNARLPLRSDGLTVNEEALEQRTVLTIEGSASGGMKRAHVNLAPGRYVLFCNMAGHYLGGMHTELIVGRR